MKKINPINCYADFRRELLNAGFSTGSSNDEGVFSLSSYFTEAVVWHTEIADTDPWEWRMTVLDDGSDIAYAKLFSNKSGFITREFYPYFLAARRGNTTAEEAYEAGKMSRIAKKIVDIIEEKGVISMHALRSVGDFSKEEMPKVEKALCDLQMKMYVTMCGRQHKISLKGDEYGWYSTVFCLTESFFGPEPFEEAADIAPEEAENIIRERIALLNPNAEEKNIRKFIFGKIR